MPYKDAEKQREFQNFWIQHNRAYWLKRHGPCAVCGASNDLQAVHRDPTKKITHRVWSWAPERREAELAKCIVLCPRCRAKRQSYMGPRGESHKDAKLTTDQVREIKRLHRDEGFSYGRIAARYGISKDSARWAIRGWRHVTPLEIWVGGVRWKDAQIRH